MAPAVPEESSAGRQLVTCSPRHDGGAEAQALCFTAEGNQCNAEFTSGKKNNQREMSLVQGGSPGRVYMEQYQTRRTSPELCV